MHMMCRGVDSSILNGDTIFDSSFLDGDTTFDNMDAMVGTE